MTNESAESRVRQTLMTMDVVDRIRQRDSELQALANSGSSDALMRERLSSLYRAQGIEVSDEIINQGIAALRERRFQYRAPSGPGAVAARLWIARRRVAVWSMISLAAVMMCFGVVSVAKGIAEKTQGREVARIHAELDQARLRRTDALARIEGIRRGFRVDVESAGHPPFAGRLDATVRRLSGKLADAERTLKLVSAPSLSIEQINGVVVLANSDATGDAAINDARRRLKGVQASVVAIEKIYDTVQSAGSELKSAIGVAEALTTANAAAMAANLPSRQEEIRQTESAAGEAALVRDDIPAANRSVSIISGLSDAVAAASKARQRVAVLRQEALATGVSGEDLAVFDRQYQRVVALIDGDDIASLKREMTTLSDLTYELGLDYELRIVTADGQRSGVWRFNKSSPGAKNYYLVVEAVPHAGGAPIPLAIRNEENGTTETVATFGVRVPESEYERVRRDKTDNGIVDSPVVGSKARGKVTRSFTVPVAGGYITRW